MAHDDERSTEFEQQLLEQIECLDVEIVRRLVEHEQVEGPREQAREKQAISFAARQRAHRRSGALWRKKKILQIPVYVLARAANLDEVRAVGDAVEHALIGIELLAKLIEVCELDSGSESNRSRRRRELAEQKTDQRRLAGTVGTDQTDAITASDRRGEVATIVRSPYAKLTSRASTTSFPDRSASCAWSFTVPTRSRRAPRSTRSASSVRTRPSLRVRRA